MILLDKTPIGASGLPDTTRQIVATIGDEAILFNKSLQQKEVWVREKATHGCHLPATYKIDGNFYSRKEVVK